jgi:hypothetical protein
MIAFGHGAGDMVYHLAVLLFLLIISIFRSKFQKRGQLISIVLIVVFFTYITMKATIFRGPEYPWNGKFFYQKTVSTHDASPLY